MISEIYTQQLIKTYGRRTVVNEVSVRVKQGEIVGLLGPNGAGKTTTFYMVVGLIKPDDGQVFLDKEEITRMPMYKRAQLGIGYLPQEASVFRKMSVEDNILSILEMTGLKKSEQKEKLENLLDEFRLHHVRKNKGDSLSGGERRRTEIARALAVDPKFILLDEPFAGVDPIAVEDIQSVVARLKYKNIGILITDHNVNETLSICDRAYLLIEGKIFKHGTAEELAADEKVRRLYLGRNFELKRKDYLHEEALRNVSDDDKINHMLRSVQYCLEETDRVVNEYISWNDYSGAIDAGLGAIGVSNGINVVEPDRLTDYCRFLDECKMSVYDYARDKNDQSLMDRVVAVPTPLFGSINPAFKPGEHSSDGGQVNFSEPNLRERLQELRSALQKLHAILENPEWNEVYSQ